MLTRFEVQGFKSLIDVRLDLPRMLVLFGPNAAGKSNFLEALQCLSRLVTERTVEDALAPPMRGYPIEAFCLPQGGMAELMAAERASFRLDANIQPAASASAEPRPRALRYCLEVSVQPPAGRFSVTDEYLAALQRNREKPYGRPIVEKQRNHFIIRTRPNAGRPAVADVGQNHTTVSAPAFADSSYPYIDALRAELTAWRTYYLDPRRAMRSARPPADVTDIGPAGESLAPYLYRLRSQHPKRFQAVRRTLRTVVPAAEDLDVVLNRERGEVEILVVQDGVRCPTRILSEGTLRVLALAAICANPWHAPLIAFEEPENGVNPRRLDLVAQMLGWLAAQGSTQVVVTTHSTRFCDCVLKEARENGRDVGLVAVGREGPHTRLRPFDPASPLFDHSDLLRQLTATPHDGVFDALVMRGLCDP